MAVAVWMICVSPAGSAAGMPPVLVEDFEFATSDEAAAAGVIDMTDPPNQPAFYENGDLPNATQGLHSIGTDAAFCINPNWDCVPGTFIGFRRLLNPSQFPLTCAGSGHYLPLVHTYGDPAHPGPVAPDFALSALTVLGDFYGDGAFADGATGTHLWVNLVDCEGEIYQFVNFSEPSLYSENWTLDVAMGQDMVRLSPASLTAVPNGDRQLTEIAAIEVFIQDADDPPTTIGTWYIDNLRVSEPNAPADWDGDGDVDLLDYQQFVTCLAGPNVPVPAPCQVFFEDADTDVDLRDVAGFWRRFGSAP